MFCSKCGAQNADDARFCNGCGASLQPSQKEKRTVNNGLTVGRTVLLLCFVGFVWLLVILATAAPSTEEHKKATVNMDLAPCGSSPGEMAEMVQAAKDNDPVGYLAISKRNGNLILDKGTPVEISAEGDGYDAVWISSGEHRAMNCWIPTKALTLDEN